MAVAATPNETAKAWQVFDSIYGADLARVKATPHTADDLALAAKLLDDAKVLTAHPALLECLCEKAFDLGAPAPAGYETALGAMTLLKERIPERRPACDEKALVIRQRQYTAARTPADRQQAGEALLEALLAVADARIEADEIQAAADLLQQAESVARAIGSERLEPVRARGRWLAIQRRAAQEMDRLKQALLSNPADAAARERLILILLLDFDDPVKAVKWLTEDCDADLRKHVLAAANPLDETPELAALEMGEWYRGLAEGAAKESPSAAYARAKAYYERFLALHAADDLVRAQGLLALKRVDEALDRLGAPQAAPAVRPGWMNLLTVTDVDKDRVEGEWVKTAEGLRGRGGYASRIVFPVALEGDYELELKCVCKSGESVKIILPVGSTLVTVGAETGYIGLGRVDERVSNPKEHPRSSSEGLPGEGVPWTMLIQVTTKGDGAGISVALNGKVLINWQGPQAALSNTVWRLPQTSCAGVGLHETEAVFTSVQVRMLTGKARLLR
ncbi:MAG: hypothetical protein WBD63_06000 [Phycisphaerae bacterium]